MHTPNSGPPPTKEGRPWIVLGVVVSALLLIGNFVAYLIYVGNGEQQAPPAPAKTAIVPVRVDEARSPPEPPPSPEPSSLSGLARAQRKAGVEAIKRGEYRKAITSLEAAATLDPELAEVASLLDVARKLDRAEIEAKRSEDRENSRTTDRRSSSRRKRRASPSEEQVPDSGILIITTEPDRVLVRIDGRPRDLTPARLEVRPGRHRVELFRGDERVFSRDIDIAARRVTLLDETLQRPTADPGRSSTRIVRENLDETGDLDLLGLLDRSPVESRTAERAPAPPPTPRTNWFAPKTGPARVLVFRPGSSSKAVAQALTGSMEGTDVEVVSQAEELGRSAPADAVIAPASVLRRVGLRPVLLAEGGSGYSLISFAPLPKTTEMPSKTIAAVADVDKKAMPGRVAEILQLQRAPRVRRVPKVEDLLSTLQLKLADAALVRNEDFAMLKRRTRRRLFTRSYEAVASANLAVAFVPGGRRAQVEPSIRGLGKAAKNALGVAGWKR